MRAVRSIIAVSGEARPYGTGGSAVPARDCGAQTVPRGRERWRNMAEPKYKLRLAFQWRESAKREVSAVREFVWEKKEDALACKALMEKATVPAGRVKIEFFEFTEAIPL